MLVPGSPLFKGGNVTGAMIGFYCPQFMGDIDTASYQFNFISDKKKLGGHVVDIKATKDTTVGHKKLLNFEFRLPEGKAFETVVFDKEF